MSKSNKKTEEKTVAPVVVPAPEAVAAPVVAKAPAPGKKKRPLGITIGRTVHFHRETQSGMSSKVFCLPAMILDLEPATSNFQDADGAIKLKIFTAHGDEVRNAVMYSEEPKKNHWTFAPGL
jgi:hypothetical protein